MGRYGLLSQKAQVLVDDAALIDACSTFLVGEFEMLHLRVKEIDNGGNFGKSKSSSQSREVEQVIEDPSGVRAKGCGKRLKSSKEKAMARCSRQCSVCGVNGHDKRTCPKLHDRLSMSPHGLFSEEKQVLLLPEKYILRRWTKNTKRDSKCETNACNYRDDSSIQSLMGRYGLLSQKAQVLVDDAALIDACSTFLVGEFEMLHLRVKEIDNGGNFGKSKSSSQSREVEQVIEDPSGVRAKGCGKRLKSSKEKAMARCSRQCSVCGVNGHDKRTCPKLHDRLSMSPHGLFSEEKQVLLLPEKYILRRWTKNTKRDSKCETNACNYRDDSSIQSLMGRYGLLSQKAQVLVDDAALIDACSTFLVGEFEMLHLRVKEIDNGGNFGKSKSSSQSREVEQVIEDPSGVRAKGCGKRLKSSKEKAMARCSRQCSVCGVNGHDKRTCPKLHDRLSMSPHGLFSEEKQVLLLPEKYILRRWTKNTKRDSKCETNACNYRDDSSIQSLMGRYGLLSQKAQVLVDDAALIDACSTFLVGEFEMLHLRVKEIDNGGNFGKSKSSSQSREVEQVIEDPSGVRAKGCGKRLKSSKEKAMARCSRQCSVCGVNGHDKRTCPKLHDRQVQELSDQNKHGDRGVLRTARACKEGRKQR
ncbi:Protein FAR1-RELATED SEQUENCE [Abeliophyllum distichum]|uniref:Protein FAR1-RELATED SEQUENCE n=1 Tax=Abeliophyllum distichum TaxID=126358 RepID=A0ABD1RXL1_9LAMI